jgi:hypothetical protein
MWSRPVSRILWSATIYLCGLPGGCFGRLAVRRNERAARASCLALLRTGFTKPHRLPGALVSSYLTFSPLLLGRSPGAVCFLWHFPRVAPPGISPASCPTESGLSSTGPSVRKQGAQPRPPGRLHTAHYATATEKTLFLQTLVSQRRSTSARHESSAGPPSARSRPSSP